ncbi:MAG: hypothetical protein GY768_08775 [Planctomycetaceae bacterium]|nr:hypothetical protein [Planctomycetaceae bacterium]
MQLLIVNLMAATSLAVSATGDLDWSTHYGNAKAKASQSNRPLLVIIENPTVAADRLDDSALVQNKERVAIVKNYELCRVDASTPYGKRVAAAFGAKTLPYTAVTDRAARYITYRRAGKMSADQWSRALGQSQRMSSVFDSTIWSTGTYCSS